MSRDGRVRIGCFPGSFDPLTIAHVAIADAAHEQCDLTRLDLVLSRSALGKAAHKHSLDERVALIEAAASTRPWMRAIVTDQQLLADIAGDYDVLVLGVDKWEQVLDPAFYGGSVEARDAAVRRLPVVACAPRRDTTPPDGALALDVPTWVREVSSTAVRAGAAHWRAVP